MAIYSYIVGGFVVPRTATFSHLSLTRRDVEYPSRRCLTPLEQFKGIKGTKEGYSQRDIALMKRSEAPTVIIGAGISGLAAAKELEKHGVTSILVEASDKPGGRVQTDVHPDGYLLDRGFQVFIEEYPEVMELFDGNYDDLNLKQFLPGAKVRYNREFHLVSDPFRRPQDILASLVSPIGTLTDKIKVGIFSVLVRFFSVNELLGREEVTTLDYLTSSNGQGLGLSKLMVERFFNPFYQGIFLSPLSVQSSRMFQFVFKMFTEGAASVPEKGMGQIGAVLANKLVQTEVRYNTRAQALLENTEDGGIDVVVVAGHDGGKQEEVVHCQNVVLAADPVASQSLVEGSLGLLGVQPRLSLPEGRGSLCLYFGFEGPPPIKDPILVLNGESQLYQGGTAGAKGGPVINNICFPSQVSAAYAPEGRSLASVTVVPQPADGVAFFSDEELEKAVRLQLESWFGKERFPECDIGAWKLLRIYRIPYAQPAQTPPYARDLDASLGSRIFVCGDHRGTATLNGAVSSGKRAAKATL